MTAAISIRRAASQLDALQGWSAAWAWSAIITLGLRVGLGLIMGAIWLVIRPYLPASALADPALSGGRTYTLPAEALLAVWPRWDALHYLNLARLGYFGPGIGVGESVFYPLYPALVAAFRLFTAGDYLVAGLVVSTLATFVALAMLYRLTEQSFGAPAARWSVLALAIYPTGFFLLAPFTESLFLALTLAAFVTAAGRRWWLAGLFGLLASLARGPGILTAAALLFVAWQQAPRWRPRKVADAVSRLPELFGVFSPLIGGGIFALWRALAGFPSVGAVLSQYSGVNLIDPVRGLALAVIQFVQVHDLPTTLDVASALVFISLWVAMLATPRWRRPEWLSYMGLNLLVFFSKRTEHAATLQSLARYVLALFPAFIVAGDWLSRSSRRARFFYALTSSLALLALAVGYSLWWFVG